MNSPGVTPIYWRVAVPVPLRRLFDYLPPYAAAEPPARGARVRVTFGKRDLIAVFWDVSTETDSPPEKMQMVRAVLERESLLSAGVLSLCEFAAQYYQHPLGEVLHTALPILLRQVDQPAPEQVPAWRCTVAGRTVALDSLARAPRQRALLQRLQQHEAGLLVAELSAEGFSAAQWRVLEKAGWIEKSRMQLDRYVSPPNSVRTTALELNEAQIAASQSIIAKAHQFAPFLLHGVTGSGKTEVYLAAIMHCIEQGRQALVLVPEIGLTPQTEARFRTRFGDRVAVLHSGISDRQRWLAFEAARKGELSVVIGTRSALFVPLKNPGLIVVDEEHDASFKQQEGFRYHARDLAVLRAQMEQIPVVLGSATPSLESLRNAGLQRYQTLTLPVRAGPARMPALRCIDLRAQTLDEGLSPPLLRAMRAHLDDGHQVLLFLNRRGFAPTLLCHHCAWVAHCNRCDSHFTLHKNSQKLRCHHCAAERAVPTRCPQCQSQSWVMLGLGTERIEQALQRHFPGHAIARIDRDTSRGRDAMARWSKAIQAGEYRILLGTQMLAKGHDFPGVTLSALLDVDGGLFATDYRAPERLAQLVTQVAGRAGRGAHAGEVLLQTHQPEHPLLQALMAGGYNAWAEVALAERQRMGLPPFQSHVLIRAEAAKREAAMQFLQRFKSRLQESAKSIMPLGPIPAPQAMRAGRQRAQLLLETAERRAWTQLEGVLRGIEKWPEARATRWSIDVDPMEMD